MPAFNPSIPNNPAPNFLYYPRREGADKGIGTALSGIGNLLGDAAKAVDQKNTQDIVQQVRDTDNQGNQYFGIDQATSDNKPTSLFNNQSASDISNPTGNPAGPPPPTVTGLSDELSIKKTQVAQGTLTPTNYDAYMNAKAKQLKAQYPQYSEEIDAQFAKVTGDKPADALRRDLITEQNKAVSASQASQRELDTFMKEKGSVLQIVAPDAVAAYAQGKPLSLPAVTAAVAGWESTLKQNEMTRSNIGVITEKGALDVKDAEQAANTIAGRYQSQIIPGMAKATQDEVNKINSSGGSLSPTEYQQAQSDVLTTRQKASDLIMGELNKPLDAQGHTLFTYLGPDGAKKVIDQALQPIDMMQEKLTNKDYGAIGTAQRLYSNQNDTRVNALIAAHPELGNVDAIRKLIGDSGWADFEQRYPDVAKALGNSVKGAMAVGTVAVVNSTDPKATIKSADQFVDAAKAAGYNVNTDKGVALEPVNAALNILQNPKTQAQADTAIQFLYSQENNGFLGKFSDTNYSKGSNVSDRQKVFNELTTPAVTARVVELSKDNPKLLTQYANWVSTQYADQVQGLTKDVNFAQASRDNLAITFDPKTAQFKYTEVASKMKGLSGGSGLIELNLTHQAEHRIDELNNTLRNAQGLYTALGDENPTFHLAKMLDTLGYDINGVNPKTPGAGNIMTQLGNAMRDGAKDIFLAPPIKGTLTATPDANKNTMVEGLKSLGDFFIGTPGEQTKPSAVPATPPPSTPSDVINKNSKPITTTPSGGLPMGNGPQLNTPRNNATPGPNLVHPITYTRSGDVANPTDVLKQVINPGHSDEAITNLSSGFAQKTANMIAAAKEAGIDLGIASGYRSHEEQAYLYTKSDKTGHMVAAPGHSNHESGKAIDLEFNHNAQAVQWAHEHAQEFGLHFPMSWENWHIEEIKGKEA